MQDSKCILQSHLQAKQDLVAERQALLQQQAAVLQEHVRAGVPLPVSSVTGIRREVDIIVHIHQLRMHCYSAAS
jgi:hypothetical protein